MALFAAGLVIALLMTTGLAAAQDSAKSNNTIATRMTTPEGYSAHHSIDAGGRMANKVGSGAMYNTMVNQQSGPRVSGESLELHKLDSNKKGLVDNAHIFGSGFGGFGSASFCSRGSFAMETSGGFTCGWSILGGGGGRG